jgi:glycerol-3-phosphate dehydrogenase
MWRESPVRTHRAQCRSTRGEAHTACSRSTAANVGWATRNGWIASRTDLLTARTNLRVALELWRHLRLEAVGRKVIRDNTNSKGNRAMNDILTTSTTPTTKS